MSPYILSCFSCNTFILENLNLLEYDGQFLTLAHSTNSHNRLSNGSIIINLILLFFIFGIIHTSAVVIIL